MNSGGSYNHPKTTGAVWRFVAYLFPDVRPFLDVEEGVQGLKTDRRRDCNVGRAWIRNRFSMLLQIIEPRALAASMMNT